MVKFKRIYNIDKIVVVLQKGIAKKQKNVFTKGLFYARIIKPRLV